MNEMAEVAALGLKVEGVESIDRANDALDRFVGAGESAERASNKLGNESRKAKQGVDNLASASRKATSNMSSMAAAAIKAAGVLAAAFSINAIKNYADSWSDMQSVVGAAIGDMSAAAGMMTKLVDIANASYSPLEQTVQVYASNVSALRDLGRGANDAAKYTESLNHMLVLTATRGERAASVQNALSKAMAVGKLQADGLETVLANGGEVASALAKELNTTVSGLRAMASQGKITSDVIANSVIKSLEDVRDRAGEMPATMADAFVIFNTNFTEFVGRIDKASGASETLANFIISLAEGVRMATNYVIAFGQYMAPAFNLAKAAISSVAQYADIAVAALAGFFAPALIGGIAMLTGALAVGLVGAIKAVTAAMLANPIGLITAALVAAGYAAYKFRDDIKQAIGVDVVDVAKTAANYVIGSFIAAYEDIKFVWNNFGDMMGAAVVGGVNMAIRAINGLIQAAVSGLNSLTGAINKVLPGSGIGTIGVQGISEISNEFSSKLDGQLADHRKNINEILSKDYIGSVFGGFKLPAPTVNEALADAAPKPPPAPPVGSGSGSKTKSDPAGDYIRQLQEQIALLGKVTEYEKALTNIQLGKYGALSQYQKDEILGYAQTLDFMREQQEEAQRYSEFIEQITGADRIKKHAEEVGFLQKAWQDGLITQEQYLTNFDLLNQKMMEVNGGYWEQYLATARESLMSFDDLAKSVIDNFTSRFGDAFESAIFDSENLSDAMQNLGSSMLRSVVNALGQMAAQWLAYQAVQLLVGKTSSAASIAMAAATGTAMAAAYAPAAAMASLASFGANSAPAMAGIASAVSLAQGLSLVGMAHDGIDSIPQTGTWLLEKGERVMTSQTSARLDSLLERIDAQQRAGRSSQPANAPAPGKGMTINLIENPERAGEVVERRDENGNDEADVFVADIFGDGKRARAIQQVFGLARVGR